MRRFHKLTALALAWSLGFFSSVSNARANDETPASSGCEEFPIELCARLSNEQILFFPPLEMLKQEERSWFGELLYEWENSAFRNWRFPNRQDVWFRNVLNSPDSDKRIKKFAHTGRQSDVGDDGHPWPSATLLDLRRKAIDHAYGDDSNRYLLDHIPFVVSELANEKLEAHASSVAIASGEIMMNIMVIWAAMQMRAKGALAEVPPPIVPESITEREAIRRLPEPEFRRMVLAGTRQVRDVVRQFKESLGRLSEPIRSAAVSLLPEGGDLSFEQIDARASRILRRVIAERGAIGVDEESFNLNHLKSKYSELKEQNFFKRLGLKEWVTLKQQEIDIALQKLAQKYHPDLTGPQPSVVREYRAKIMDLILEAYETLSNRTARGNYFRALHPRPPLGEPKDLAQGNEPGFSPKMVGPTGAFMSGGRDDMSDERGWARMARIHGGEGGGNLSYQGYSPDVGENELFGYRQDIRRGDKHPNEQQVFKFMSGIRGRYSKHIASGELADDYNMTLRFLGARGLLQSGQVDDLKMVESAYAAIQRFNTRISISERPVGPFPSPEPIILEEVEDFVTRMRRDYDHFLSSDPDVTDSFNRTIDRLRENRAIDEGQAEALFYGKPTFARISEDARVQYEEAWNKFAHDPTEKTFRGIRETLSLLIREWSPNLSESQVSYVLEAVFHEIWMLRERNLRSGQVFDVYAIFRATKNLIDNKTNSLHIAPEALSSKTALTSLKLARRLSPKK